MTRGFFSRLFGKPEPMTYSERSPSASPPPRRRWTIEEYFAASTAAVEEAVRKDELRSLTEVFKAEIEETPRGKMLCGVLLDHIVRAEAELEYPRELVLSLAFIRGRDEEMPKPCVTSARGKVLLHLVSGEKMPVRLCTLAGAWRAKETFAKALKTGETQTSEPPAAEIPGAAEE